MRRIATHLVKQGNKQGHSLHFIDITSIHGQSAPRSELYRGFWISGWITRRIFVLSWWVASLFLTVFLCIWLYSSNVYRTSGKRLVFVGKRLLGSWVWMHATVKVHYDMKEAPHLEISILILS